MAQRQAETDGNACRELRPSKSDVVRWRRTSEVRVSLQESITPEFRAFYPRGTFKLSQAATNQSINQAQSSRVAPITCVDRVAKYFLILLTTSRTTTPKNSPAPPPQFTNRFRSIVPVPWLGSVENGFVLS